MLHDHFKAVEGSLLAISRIPANSGHTLHRGTPREAFIREFLTGHLSERVAVGSGEIIDAASESRQPRNQFDIVIYRRDFPRLDFGGGVNGFLIESVVATIEVKSILDAAGVAQSTLAASRAKQLKGNLVTSFMAGHQPPAVLNYVVAYDGPASMSTVHGWTQQAHATYGISVPNLPVPNRTNVASPSIDGIFVLGKGFWYFDNVPMGLMTDQVRQQFPQLKWVHADSAENNLLLLFLLLTSAISGASASWLNPIPYVENIPFGPVQWSG